MKTSETNIKIANKRFVERFKQQAKLALSNTKVNLEINKIRKLSEIPITGFRDWGNDVFLNWLSGNKKNGYKKISSIFKGCDYIKAKPEYFLGRVEYFLENDEYPDSLYFLDSKEYFDSVINERPFPGIVHYILFNKVFLPESNGLQLGVDRVKKNKYIVLRFGPNATKEDFVEMFPLVNWLQKSLLNYSKSKSRKIKNLEKKLMVVNKKMAGYDAVDELYGDDLKDDLKKLIRVRQVKSRIKKSIKKYSDIS